MALKARFAGRSYPSQSWADTGLRDCMEQGVVAWSPGPHQLEEDGPNDEGPQRPLKPTERLIQFRIFISESELIILRQFKIL